MKAFKQYLGEKIDRDSFRKHWKKAPILTTGGGDLKKRAAFWNSYFKHFEDKYGEIPNRIKSAMQMADTKPNPSITYKGRKFSMRTGMDEMDLLYHVLNESVSDLHEARFVDVKGWANGQKRKLVLWKPKSGHDIRPYHTQHLTNNPKDYGLKEEDFLKVLARSYGFDPEDMETLRALDGIKSGKYDRDKDIDNFMYGQGWARIVLNDGIGSIEGPIKANLHSAAKLIAKKYTWSQIDFMEIGDILKDNAESIGDEDTWKSYLKTGRVPKRTSIGSTMARFREHVDLSEAYKGDMLIGWVDPKNKLILHPEGGRMGRFHTQVLTNKMSVEEFRKFQPDRIGVDITKDMVKFVKSGDMTEAQLKHIIDKSYENIYNALKAGKSDGDYDTELNLEKAGWVKIRIDRKPNGRSSVLGDLDRCQAAAKVIDKKLGGWQGIKTDQFWVRDGGTMVADEKTWDTYVKTGRVPKRTDIGKTMSRFR
jgi:hypothetical protein